MTTQETAAAIRHVVHTELEACVEAINHNDKKASLDHLSAASVRLKRLAGELIRQFG